MIRVAAIPPEPLRLLSCVPNPTSSTARPSSAVLMASPSTMLRSRGTVGEVIVYAFDLLGPDSDDLRTLSLGDRKTRPARLLARRHCPERNVPPTTGLRSSGRRAA